MITLIMQLSVGPWTWQEATQQTIREFPGEVALFSSDPTEGVRLKLNQDYLTDEQRDWLHLSTFAGQHIESYHIRHGTAKPNESDVQLALDVVALRRENERLRALLCEEETQEDRDFNALITPEIDDLMNQRRERAVAAMTQERAARTMRSIADLLYKAEYRVYADQAYTLEQWLGKRKSDGLSNVPLDEYLMS